MSEAPEKPNPEAEAPQEEAAAIVPAEGAEAEGAAEAKSDPDEDAARRRGWRPQDEYTGDKPWVDAKTFMARERDSSALANKALKSAEKRIANLEKTIKDFADYHSKTEQRAYERAVRDLRGRQAAFAEAGDVEGVHQVTEEIVALTTEAAKGGPRPQAEEDDAAPLEEWKADNPWFDQDRVMKGAAIEIAQELAERGVVGEAQLAEVSRRIRAEFPHKFAKPTNPNRTAAVTVETGSPARPRGKTRSDLPADARSTMDRWIKEGLVTEAQYLKDYFS